MFSSLFRRRDPSLYPRDECGDLLYALMKRFRHPPDKVLATAEACFDTEADADAFAASQTKLGHQVYRDHDPDDSDDGLGAWKVDVDVTVAPTHHEVKRALTRLRRDVQSYRGKTCSVDVEQWEEP